MSQNKSSELIMKTELLKQRRNVLRTNLCRFGFVNDYSPLVALHRPQATHTFQLFQLQMCGLVDVKIIFCILEWGSEIRENDNLFEAILV